MDRKLRRSFDRFGQEVLVGIRARASERIDDERYDEMILGIEKATAAMVEAGVTSEVIIKMLQKYWDLRLSEAESFVENCRNSNFNTALEWLRE